MNFDSQAVFDLEPSFNLKDQHVPGQMGCSSSSQTAPRHGLCVSESRSRMVDRLMAGWWWMVAMNFLFPLILGLGIIIPIDELHHFSEVWPWPTNQMVIVLSSTYSTYSTFGHWLPICPEKISRDDHGVQELMNINSDWYTFLLIFLLPQLKNLEVLWDIWYNMI